MISGCVISNNIVTRIRKKKLHLEKDTVLATILRRHRH